MHINYIVYKKSEQKKNKRKINNIDNYCLFFNPF